MINCNGNVIISLSLYMLRSKSEPLLDEMNRLIDHGELTFEQVKDTEIYQTIENIN